MCFILSLQAVTAIDNDLNHNKDVLASQSSANSDTTQYDVKTSNDDVEKDDNIVKSSTTHKSSDKSKTKTESSSSENDNDIITNNNTLSTYSLPESKGVLRASSESNDDIKNSESNSIYSAPKSNQKLGVGEGGSFSTLKKEIDAVTDGLLILNGDYTWTSGDKAITISKNINALLMIIHLFACSNLGSVKVSNSKEIVESKVSTIPCSNELAKIFITKFAISRSSLCGVDIVEKD